VPFLGICIGMQLLYDESEESPGRSGLGVLPGAVRRLPDGVKHPQMQWNTVALRNGSPLFAELPDPAWFYFVHSFAPDDLAHATATCDYGGTVVAAVERDNVAAMQFHPEKSGANGLHVLGNFVARCAA
jgi:glutamine amidotransferase